MKTSSPVPESQSLIVLSSLAEAIRLPSELKAIPRDLLGMAPEHMDPLACRNIPDSRDSIVAGGRDSQTGGVKRQRGGGHLGRRSNERAERSDLPARRLVPEMNDSVRADAAEPAASGAVHELRQTGDPSGQSALLTSTRGIPEPDRPVFVGRGKDVTVGTERNGADVGRVALE